MSDNDAPVARLTGIAPVLLVKNVLAAAEHYRDAMGFTIALYNEEAGFIIVERDGMNIMLQRADDPAHVVANWTLKSNLWDVYFWVDNVDKLYEELIKRGAQIDYGLSDKPYHVREFGARDLDDHDIAFGQLLSK